MFSRVGITLLVCCWCIAPAAAQVVRFETSVGDFDMVLNPTDNPLLETHVANMLQYVEENRYLGSWINRADTGFVLQMGNFFSHTKRPPMTIDSTRPVAAYDPIPGVSPQQTGLSNTVGTVSLALSAGNANSGSSSFFVNLGDNSFLDDQDFTVFAAISDMTVVNEIMGLTTVDRTTDTLFGAGPGNLAFTDVPVQENGFQVFINRAFVVTDAMTIARATAAVQSVMETSTAADGSTDVPTISLDSLTTVPEPSAGILFLTGLLGMRVVRRCRRG